MSNCTNKKPSPDDLRKRAYMIRLSQLDDPNVIITGGKMILWGEERFVPIGTQLQKPRHCASCTSFRKGSGNSTCMLTRDFCNRDTDACERYENRTHHNF